MRSTFSSGFGATVAMDLGDQRGGLERWLEEQEKREEQVVLAKGGQLEDAQRRRLGMRRKEGGFKQRDPKQTTVD